MADVDKHRCTEDADHDERKDEDAVAHGEPLGDIAGAARAWQQHLGRRARLGEPQRQAGVIGRNKRQQAVRCGQRRRVRIRAALDLGEQAAVHAAFFTSLNPSGRALTVAEVAFRPPFLSGAEEPASPAEELILQVKTDAPTLAMHCPTFVKS